MKSTPLTRGFQTIARALAKLPLSRAAALLAAAVTLPVTAATTDNALKMEVMAAPNLVVDSNVESPSSYSPRAAHFGVKITNTGASALTDIYVMMGNLTNASTGAGTPGTYPVTTVPAVPAIGYSGTFFFTHEGTAVDATRYLPSLAAGESTTVYWLVSYPLKDLSGNSVTAAANVTSDDLRLDYDVWVQATEGVTPRLVYDECHATCRSEISAAANKIWPNTTSKVPPEYLNAIETALGWRPNPLNPRVPGAYVQEGIWYDLGNVGAGFDNDGDGLPDRNAWMQPVGDPSVYNALASRLVKCYGLVIVKLNDGTEQLIPFEDRLYFQNLPGNNTGAIGLVYYEFIPLNSTLSSTLTPYQEVASGYDNEKFNGDYGVVVGTVASTPPSVTLGKTATVTAAPGGTVSYTLTTTNTGTTPYGWPGQSLPIVMEDAIPTGLTYVLNSATSGSNVTVPAGGVFTVYYSIDGGSTWTTTQPAAASVTHLRWVLDRSLAASASATVAFQATVGGAYAGISVVNTGILKSGTATQVTTATATTTMTGNNSVGDFVWRDLNRNGTYESATETGIANIKVSLYIDSDNDGTLDLGEPLFRTTSTDTNGGYGFATLLDMKYIVVVDVLDPDLPAGYSLPNSVTAAKAVNLDFLSGNPSAVNVLTADWPFMPALEVVKSVSPTSYKEGDLITYNIAMTNHSAALTGNVNVVQTQYASAVSGNKPVQLPGNLVGAPDGVSGNIDFAASADDFTTSGGYAFTGTPGVTTFSKVELLLRMKVTKPMNTTNPDEITLKLGVSGAAIATFPTSGVNPLSSTALNGLVGATGDKVIDITSKVGATWTLAQAQSLVVSLLANKDSAGDKANVLVDAIGVRVTGTGVAGTYGSSTIFPLPLTDTYDSTKLEYVSASVNPTSISTAVPTAATLYWSDVGLLNAGTTNNITVTFRALALTDTTGDGKRDSITTANGASCTNAYFVSGVRTNDASSTVNVTVNPTGFIGNYVFWDVNASGTQDAGDIGLQNVVVSLYTSADVLFRQTLTDAAGGYLFRGVVDGSYYIKIETNDNNEEYSLPWPSNSTSVTFDPDMVTTPQSATGPTIVINNADTVTTNDYYTNQDFGFDNNTYSLISGTIFTDHDGDGVRDVGDDPIVGLTVTRSGSGITTATTDANGFYSFGSLAAGSYTVTVTPPASTTNTLDPDGAKNSTTTFPVTAGLAYPNKNFAYQPTGTLTLGDTLYYDFNKNNTQDSGEPGIANVTTNLYYDTNADGIIDPLNDALIASSTTNASGVYGYTGLPAGDYIMAVDLTDPDFPAGMSQTQAFDGIPDSKAKIHLTVSIDTVDLGYVPDAIGTGTIGNVVWLDSNNDGLKGTNEAGINGVTVELYHASQTPGTHLPMATTTTAGGGFYSFSTLPSGDWFVYIPVANFTGGALLTNPLSSSNTDTADNQQDGDDNGIQTAVSTATRSPVIRLTETESDQTVDFGFNSTTARIGDTVFYDLNANGSQDYSETGINGVTVNLYLDANDDNVADGAAIATTTTDTVGGDPGVYAFTGLAPNRYIVKVDTTTGGLSTMLQTSDPDLDGIPVNNTDGNPANNGDNADTDILLSSGANYTGADFGYQPPGTIGDFVWLDVDRDGVQDLGEPGIQGVTVRITNGTNTYDVLTDSDGYWGKTLAAGSWTVSIPSLPTSTISTYDADNGTTSPNASVAVVVNGSGVVTTPAGLAQGNLGLDFGFALNGPYSLSGTIAIHDTGAVGTADDVDNFANDGVDMDAGVTDETELSGVEVFLYTNAGVFLGSTFTDADGNYSFAGLPNGTYRVIIGTTAAPLSNATLTTTTLNNLSGSTVTSTATSVKQVLTIADSSKVNVDFTFNSNSDYDFGDLPSSYGMTTLAQDGARHIIPASGAIYLGTAPDADTNGIPTSTANGDDIIGSDDEGGVTAVSIGYWADGAATAGTGVSNATGGDIQAVVTGSGWLVGWVDWNNDKDFLDSGEMIISQAVTTGTLALPFAIPAGTISSTVTESWLSRFRLFPTEPAFPTFAYTGEATNGEVEDHLFEKTVGGSIGDLVWRDTDGDGVIDSGENGIGGVVVELRDASNVLIKSQTTSNGSLDVDGDGVIDPVGYYRFRTLANGTTPLPDATYKIVVPSIPGYSFSYNQDTGTTSPDGITTVALSGGNQYLLADFGYRPQLANLSGQVRYDTDGDGNPLDGDSGATGVTIQLWTDPNGDGDLADGVQVAEIVTNGSGNYTFSNVASGSYVIVEINPTGSTSTYDVAGANDDKIPVTMAGVAITGRDFLDTATYAISGTVFNDFNYNSAINVGTDTLLVGVTVRLYTDENNNGIVDGLDLLIGTTTTNGLGAYSFGSLPPGNYLVVETDPTAYKSMTDADGNSNGASFIDVAIVAADITGRDFLDYHPACPDVWTAWQTKWDLVMDLADLDLTDNPDGDRYNNLMEYAFCLPPNSGVGKPFCLEPSLTVTGGIDGVFRRTAGGTTDVTYTLERTAALGNPTNWATLAPITLNSGNTTVTINADGTEKVRIVDLETLTGLTAGKGFVRMRATIGANSSATEVLGWTETALNSTCSTFNNPFLRCSTYTGTVSSVSGQNVVFSGENFASLLEVNEEYYLEVTSGDNVGHRFDVASASGTNIVVENDTDLYAATAPFNTLTGAPPANLAGDTVVLRRHWQLGVQFPVSTSFTTGFAADTVVPINNPPDADQIQVYTNGAWVTYYAYDADGTGSGLPIWTLLGGGIADRGATVLPPGQGVFVSRPNPSILIVSYGEVRENKFIRPLQSGGTAALRNNLVGGGFPIDQSANAASPAPYLSDREMNLTPTAVNGFFGSRDFKTADSFFIWKGDTTGTTAGYDSYYLLSRPDPDGAGPLLTVLKWVIVGDAGLAAKDSDSLFKSDRSVFIRVAAPLPSYTIPCPWTP